MRPGFVTVSYTHLYPDEGQIFINGKEEVIKTPKDALNLGIGMVHQLSLIHI